MTNQETTFASAVDQARVRSFDEAPHDLPTYCPTCGRRYWDERECRCTVPAEPADPVLAREIALSRYGVRPSVFDEYGTAWVVTINLGHGESGEHQLTDQDVAAILRGVGGDIDRPVDAYDHWSHQWSWDDSRCSNCDCRPGGGWAWLPCSGVTL